MMHDHLQSQLDRVATRYQRWRRLQGLACVWLLAALIGIGVWMGKSAGWLASGWMAPVLAFGALGGALLTMRRAGRNARDLRWVAQRVEAAFPELQTCLLAAIEQRPEYPGERYGYLQVAVIQQALRHANHHPWSDVVPTHRLAIAAWANLLAFGLFIGALTGAALTVGPPLANAVGLGGPRFGASGTSFTVSVEPGNTEVERGASLLVLARIQGAMPAEAVLVSRSGEADEVRVPMSAGLEDPVFGGRMAAVHEPLDYYVELGDTKSPTYHVEVFEYPRLERLDAQLNYPDYTGLEERLIQDVRTLSVVAGTKLTLRALLNKPVVSAQFADAEVSSGRPAGKQAEAVSTGEPIVLKPTSDEPKQYEGVLLCTESRRLTLQLVDDAGRANTQKATLSIKVLPNSPVSIKPVFPARDVEVSALEELEVKATVFDDFGLKKVGISYSIAGESPVEVVLSEQMAGKQKHELRHLMSLESLHAEPDQLLSYYWWAEDVDAAGQLRRTSSDMYFAEVRPFEEIFRQGEQPPGGEQQQRQQRNQQGGDSPGGQEAQQLAQLQKEIINATWKVIRRELGAKVSTAFADDVEQIELSQSSALEQAGGLEERLQDEKSKAHLEEVLAQMQKAIERLKLARDGASREPLQQALAAEQAAYQSLLKLRAREHEVVRQQQQQSGQQSRSQQNSARSNQQRQQMQQLQLREQENRYESQRAAQQQQEESAEERENRQVLNRLRELARRQHDLNERLKELQSALEEAQDPQKKEEVQKQLQRLQEEQRQMLQDTDELQSRLDQPENAERMAEQRQQLEETRDQVQRASEALEQQAVTRAAAAGSRAEQQLDDLREEFRRRAANRFSEEMKQMRESARELEQRENELSRELNEPNDAAEKNRSLRDDTSRSELAEQLQKQRQRLSGLQDQMRDVVQRAEETEPVLTNRLYDASRNAQDRQVERSLQQAERSVRQGLMEDARQQEVEAGQAIQQLREGIERAAEGVLGDESEALRRAREELRNLREDLQREMQREGATPQPGQPQPGQPQPGQPQPGQPQPGQPQPGQPQPGQPQPGQQQPGQQQPGQQQRGGRTGPQRLQDGTQEPRSDRLGGTPQGIVDEVDQGPRVDGERRALAPIGGEDFRDWSDRLRDVEEMVDSPELRAEAARIRERARQIRAEQKRHSAPPNWDLVRAQVAEPLVELESRVSEELLRRTSKDSLVPLDRDPVPPSYSERMRRYYERIGSGK